MTEGRTRFEPQRHCKSGRTQVVGFMARGHILHRRFFRWRANVLKLKPRPLENSFCRMPQLKNSDTNRRTPARVCRLGTTTGCSLFIPPLQHRPPPLEQVRCSNAYECGGALKSTGIPFCAICDELKLLKSSEDPEVRGFQSERVTRLSTRSIGTGRPPTSGIRSNLPQLS